MNPVGAEGFLFGYGEPAAQRHPVRDVPTCKYSALAELGISVVFTQERKYLHKFLDNRTGT